MSRRVDRGRWMARSLLVGLIAASGCASTRSTSWPSGQDRPAPMQDVDTSQDMGALGRLHGWIVGQRNGRIDPSLLH